MGPASHQTHLGLAIATISFSFLLYLFGMASNDALDVEKDRQLRPERPIPSGQLQQSDVAKVIFAIVLGMFGLSLALPKEQSVFFIASAVAILLYNGPFKKNFLLALLAIASARGLNFLGAFGPSEWDGLWTVPLASIFLHTITILTLSKGEDEDLPVSSWMWGLNGLSALPMFAYGLYSNNLLMLVASLFWCAFTTFNIWKLRTPKRQVRPQLIGAMVGAFTLLDASYLYAFGHPRAAAAFIVLYLLGKRWSRRFPPG